MPQEQEILLREQVIYEQEDSRQCPIVRRPLVRRRPFVRPRRRRGPLVRCRRPLAHGRRCCGH